MTMKKFCLFILGLLVIALIVGYSSVKVNALSAESNFSKTVERELKQIKSK